MNSSTLKHPVMISQVPLPLQVCYIVPIDAPAPMLTAIFEECHGRWGGRDSLLMPMLPDGTIDECYWSWARVLDPDVVYSYIALDVPLLERIDHDLMPGVIITHPHVVDPGDFRPRHDHEATGLPTLSLLPMIANTDRLGPPRPYTLLSAFPAWDREPFITDTFGLNPYGPGWVQAETVRKYVKTLALGSQTAAQRGHVADTEVADPTALLRAISDGTYLAITMAQLSGWGYEELSYEIASPWQTFNIIVGDTSLDRLAFWNSRIGVDDYQRRNIVAVRIDERHLDDPNFIDAFTLFVARWNTSTSQNGPSWAAIRSSSVPDDRFQALREMLARVNVHAIIEHFTDANACAPDGAQKRGFVRPGIDQRYAESKVPLIPLQPRHLARFGPMSSWLSKGSWVVRLTLKREKDEEIYSSVPTMPVPRRWQAVRSLVRSSLAKAAIGGDLRLVVSGEQPHVLSFTDDAAFVAELFLPHHCLTTTDPRNAIPARAAMLPQTSSAGRHLRGLLNKLGSIHSAYDVLEDQFWKAVLLEMAVPREVFDDTKRSTLAARLEAVIRRDGPAALGDTADFENLAETLARIAPDLKTPVAQRNYEWFVKMYRETDACKRKRDVALTPEEVERQIQQEVEEQLRWRCAERVLIQGHDWKCPRCLHRNWATVASLRPVLTCDVCLREQAVPAHFMWDFLLDGYVARGLRERGLRGLVWVLGYLSSSARNSFMFSPPLDLISGDQLVTDADIACVVDDKFIIAEVKESVRNINEGLADSLVCIARIVRPDVVILACSDPTAFATVTRLAAQMHDELRDVGVSAMPLVRSEHDADLPAIMVGKGFWRNVQAPAPAATEPR